MASEEMKKRVLESARTLLTSINAEYIVLLDGTEYTNFKKPIPEQQPLAFPDADLKVTRKKQKARIFENRGIMDYVREQMKGMAVGDSKQVPLHGYSANAVQSALAGNGQKWWGLGATKTCRIHGADGDAITHVEVLRIK